ncbi:MAG: hypothetical protein AAGL49_10775 [Pseudomonadota bacterium]
MSHVTVFAGVFASQPLVFAHLLDAADASGLSLDLDHVEVLQGAVGPRLAHVLSDADCSTVEDAQRADETLVLVFSEALIPGARLFRETKLLRSLGQFAPTRPRMIQ